MSNVNVKFIQDDLITSHLRCDGLQACRLLSSPGKSFPMPTWTRPQAEQSIPVQKWNSPHGGQVRYTDAGEGASNERERSSDL